MKHLNEVRGAAGLPALRSSSVLDALADHVLLAKAHFRNPAYVDRPMGESFGSSKPLNDQAHTHVGVSHRREGRRIVVAIVLAGELPAAPTQPAALPAAP